MAGYDIQPLNLSGYNIRNGLVSLGEGVEVTEDQLRRVNWGDYRKLTRGLAAILFSPWELATSSVTGQRWSRASLHDGRPCKPALDKNKVRAILAYVTSRFPEIEVSKIKQVLAYKCKESASALKVRLGPMPRPMPRPGSGPVPGPVS
ncbi:hypothetical protein R5R35_012000 [Gryllus longicercus]|uniref:BEN domain-containing protein n=1 Tax=Gryllus longicercus TaxID=2509291 RepID=A0AAN9ZCS0_9ORTH